MSPGISVLPLRSMTCAAWLFSAFIFACGITHVMDVWTVWQPDYGAQVLAKACICSP